MRCTLVAWNDLPPDVQAGFEAYPDIWGDNIARREEKIFTQVGEEGWVNVANDFITMDEWVALGHVRLSGCTHVMPYHYMDGSMTAQMLLRPGVRAGTVHVTVLL